MALISLVATGFNVHSPKTENSDLLEWQTSKLSWSDFQGQPEYYGSNAALTSYQIGFTYNYEGGNEIEFIVKCQFIKSGSWVKRVAKTDYILNHEQKHFDLAEVYARKLRKTLNLTDFRGKKLREVDRIIDQLYDENWKGLTAEQDQYDREAEHGIDKVDQKRWDGIIQTKLDKLSAYTSPRVRVRK